ncbi:MAG: hypothetical protein GAK41_00606 [Burkholderia gladioli]|nr:MAG: hypothetical protein GAK41_00606 [Burkholderia gladioli]
MMVGAAPFGVIFGTLVTAGPLAWRHGELMSLIVFAGSAQFIAIGLLAGGAGALVVIATTLIVTLRHLLYSATLAPYVAHLPLRWRATLGALMTDEVFAVAYARYRHTRPGEMGPRYFASLEFRVGGFFRVKGGQSPAQRTLDAEKSTSTLEGSGQAKPCAAWPPSARPAARTSPPWGGARGGKIPFCDVGFRTRRPFSPTQISREPSISGGTSD